MAKTVRKEDLMVVDKNDLAEYMNWSDEKIKWTLEIIDKGWVAESDLDIELLRFIANARFHDIRFK